MDAEGDTYKITAEFTDEAGIPTDAELVVTEADPSYYMDAARDALNWTDSDVVFYTKFLDISFMKDGVEIKPTGSVKVTIQLLDVTAGQKHLMVALRRRRERKKVTSQAENDGTVEFTTSSFSVFGIGNALHEVQEAENDLANVTILSFDAPNVSTEEEEPEQNRKK